MGKKHRLCRTFKYTLTDIGGMVGLSRSTVRVLASGRTFSKKTVVDGKVVETMRTVPPVFDPHDLESVVAFILERSSDHQRRMAEAVLAAASGGVAAGAAALGISRSALYRRAKKAPTS